MEFTGQFTSSHTAAELWNYFTDPDILAESAPGCDSMTMVSPSELETSVAVGVGSVKPSFDVDMVVTEADRPHHLQMEASGSASRNSFTTVATMDLTETDGETVVDWRAEADVSGLIASMGQRALGSVANKLVGDFFSNVESLADEDAPAESKLRAEDDADASPE